jgi:A/G-specific adenine glycosylase
MNHKKFFSNTLLEWDRRMNFRKMPWKGEKDPYKIWISEIILQQTRVQQGLNYYERFIAAFPDVNSLAIAKDQDVLKLWEGLGYYSRCRNLIASARYIHEKLNNIFPNSFEEIIALKGVGNYTASAIASFAFNQPYAVVDGNVFRVLSRFFGIEIPINTSSGKKFYGELATGLLDKTEPALYNQAIMDFGAVVCKPAIPDCPVCPLRKKCVAYKENRTTELPVNDKIINRKERFFNYFIVEHKGKIYIKERVEKDIWQNLNEFILFESDHLFSSGEIKEIIPSLTEEETKPDFVSEIYTQKLTHQTIRGRFVVIRVQKPVQTSGSYQLLSKKELAKLPFPKIITAFLEEKNVSLNLV